ncbi:MAG: hydrogenase expression/formation protein HypE [Deltaproteobacteria bacterium]|jgi:hydrogenase expression/formation protein HypE|nr:hydrogenase expression/formation protein HypE [Deltaproteobacteria bacterium]
MEPKIITINHGAGGRLMHEFIHDSIVAHLGNSKLDKMDDSSVLQNYPHKLPVLTTDSYVVHPVFFSGGDIGRLCVCGTVNDLAASGAEPLALTLSFILEEGFELEKLDKIIASIGKTAKEAGVEIVTGDTKVVEKGKGDGIFINTAGLGFVDPGVSISSHNTLPGDLVLVTGPLGNHEMALFKDRENMNFQYSVQSDVTPLNLKVKELLAHTRNIHTIKDPTRGGLASALTEIAQNSQVRIELEEEKIPVDKEVKAMCDLVGFDPLYLANEGKYIIVCPPEETPKVKAAFGSETTVIGQVEKGQPDLILNTASGGNRRLIMMENIQLPRIC